MTRDSGLGTRGLGGAVKATLVADKLACAHTQFRRFLIGMPDAPAAPPVAPSSPKALPPRVLIILPDQWPRALLRATLRERGYDAIGTRSVASALRIAPRARERGPVDVLIFDQEALSDSPAEQGGPEIEALLGRYPSAATILVARATVRPPDAQRPWTRILRRPVTVEDIAVAVEALRPLRPEARAPLE